MQSIREESNETIQEIRSCTGCGGLAAAVVGHPGGIRGDVGHGQASNPSTINAETSDCNGPAGRRAGHPAILQRSGQGPRTAAADAIVKLLQAKDQIRFRDFQREPLVR